MAERIFRRQTRLPASRGGDPEALPTEFDLISFPQAELVNDREVSIAVGGAQVVQQTVARADHLEQAAPTGVVLLVIAHVVGQLINARRQKGNLDFGRARVGFLAAELTLDLGFAFLRNRHHAPHYSVDYDSYQLVNNNLPICRFVKM